MALLRPDLELAGLPVAEQRNRVRQRDVSHSLWDRLSAMLRAIRKRCADERFKSALLQTGNWVLLELTFLEGKWRSGPDGNGKNLYGLALMCIRSEFQKEPVWHIADHLMMDDTLLDDDALWDSWCRIVHSAHASNTNPVVKQQTCLEPPHILLPLELPSAWLDKPDLIGISSSQPTFHIFQRGRPTTNQ